MSRHRLSGALAAGLGLLAMSASGALAAEGDLDNSFSGDGRLVFNVDNGRGEGVAVDSKGRIVEAGNIDPPGADTSDIAVARFLPDGSPDPSFSGDGLATVNAGGGTNIDVASAVSIDQQGRIVRRRGGPAGWRLERRDRPLHRLGRSGSRLRRWQRRLHTGPRQQRLPRCARHRLIGPPRGRGRDRTPGFAELPGPPADCGRSPRPGLRGRRRLGSAQRQLGRQQRRRPRRRDRQPGQGDRRRRHRARWRRPELRRGPVHLGGPAGHVVQQ